jgi:hypothetical protein
MAVIWIKIGMDKSQDGSWVNNFVEEMREATGDPSVNEYTYIW